MSDTTITNTYIFAIYANVQDGTFTVNEYLAEDKVYGIGLIRNFPEIQDKSSNNYYMLELYIQIPIVKTHDVATLNSAHAIFDKGELIVHKYATKLLNDNSELVDTHDTNSLHIDVYESDILEVIPISQKSGTYIVQEVLNDFFKSIIKKYALLHISYTLI